ncbi:hypothetical protein C8D87_105493 [Lentzea atacamensis]|uniref:DUF4267 domain-containing protein n=1 Tax=Lentzea atacamensis TaxID=531938 RepID=A0ABX9E6M7_9PSEU|nr:hypothetical protein [Lentzea atacamensis]RAS64998.1 hypothetical protein C8D87_105493 [Lentzea atacamensis]
MNEPGEGLLRITGIASVVFTIGTAVHAFVIINDQTLQRMFELAGAEPVPGFLTVFRAVGCLYVAGNALGVLALQGKPRTWLFWVVITVNATQAAGVLMVPPEMWTAVREAYGIPGRLPSLITDGGALVLVVTLAGTAIATRSVRTQKKPARKHTERAAKR